MEVFDIFRALGHPTRIEMVERIARGSNHTISTVSQDLTITRQGARKHLQILADAQIVTLKKSGRDTEVYLLRDTLDQGKAFISHLEKQWDIRLNALRNFVEQEETYRR